MSKESKQQVRTYLNGLYRQFLDDIGSSRNLSRAELHDIADNMKVRFAEDAVTYGLVDSLKYKDEIIDVLKARFESKIGFRIQEKNHVDWYVRIFGDVEE